MCTQSYFIPKHRLLFQNLKISKDACSKSQQKRKPKNLNRCLKQDQGKGNNPRSQIRIYLCEASHRNLETKVQAEAFLVKQVRSNRYCCQGQMKSLLKRATMEEAKDKCQQTSSSMKRLRFSHLNLERISSIYIFQWTHPKKKIIVIATGRNILHNCQTKL